MRKAIAIVTGLALLAAANFTIYSRERQLAEGAVVLLELAPVDPRSLMQGDYMALRFKVADDAFGRTNVGEVGDGYMVVSVDDRRVGSFVRRDKGEVLAPSEVRLRYRIRDERVKFATNAFFFQEGQAKQFERARYGEFRVAQSGDLLLTNVRGEKLEMLGTPKQ